MASDLDAVRRHLLSLARREEKRIIDHPNDWQPYEVNNPYEPGQQFNDETAWEFIIRLLEEGHVIEEDPQKKPPGVIAYRLIAPLGDGWLVFIKIRPGKQNCICGRSFHYDERQL
jgi:hypothetical protein